MLRKLFIGIAKAILGLFLLIVLLYGGFHLWEYVTGGKFVTYLTTNSETIALEKSFSYKGIEEDLKKNKLILVGEIHGFEEPNKFDVDFFKYLHKNHRVQNYIAEFDFVQAIYLNDFLKTGNVALLKKALENWAVIQGRNNKDYYNKYVELHKYYVQLPENNKFKIIGVDKIQDRKLTSHFLKRLIPELSNIASMDNETILSTIDSIKNNYSGSPDTLLMISHIKTNIQHLEKKVNRGEVMFQNFQYLYNEYSLSTEKVYGYFGIFHVFQYRVNGQHPLASRIRQSDLGLENQILSVNFMMNDSYMVTASKKLPEFMRDQGKYTRMPISADNLLFMYIVGIKDLKRMTPENHKSFIKMNAENNPYSSSIRLNKIIQLLPVTDIFELDDKGKPYVQYTIFVRNSDWAEPME